MITTKPITEEKFREIYADANILDLFYIRDDCRQPLKDYPNHPNEKHYLDQIHYAVKMIKEHARKVEESSNRYWSMYK